MTQYQVPQFIETESKLIGPLTLKQFLYIAAAALLSFFTFFVLRTFAWIILTGLVGIIAVSLAFVKYNGRPLTVILKSAFLYLWQPKFYIWQKSNQVLAIPKVPEVKLSSPAAGLERPVSKIKNMWMSLITKKPTK